MADQHIHDPYPQVTQIELPAQALRLPLSDDDAPDFSSDAALAALQEQFVPLISTAIARKARQRRYAP